MSEKRANVLELRHPFLLPMWRRVVFVAALAGWTVVEIVAGNPFWALLMGGIGVYAVYVLFFDFILPDSQDEAL